MNVGSEERKTKGIQTYDGKHFGKGSLNVKKVDWKLILFWNLRERTTDSSFQLFSQLAVYNTRTNLLQCRISQPWQCTGTVKSFVGCDSTPFCNLVSCHRNLQCVQRRGVGLPVALRRAETWIVQVYIQFARRIAFSKMEHGNTACMRVSLYCRWVNKRLIAPLEYYRSVNTGLFISPSVISELDCAATKTDTAERSISIDRESLQVFFVLGALAYFQVPPLGGSREEKWRSQ